jgi:hypothetical protein
MSQPQAHLLALPRELRNQIYTHLIHQLDFTWDRDMTAPRGNEGDYQLVEPVPVRVPQCPMAHVLRIHPQITAEYGDMMLRNLEAVMNPSFQNIHAFNFKPQEGHGNGGSGGVVPHIRHITIFIKLHARSTARSLDWGDQLSLLKDVTEKSERLQTLRLAVRQQYVGNAPTVLDKDLGGVLLPAVFRASLPTEFLPAMPAQIANLALIQRGEGYHVGHGGTYLHANAQSHTHRPQLVVAGAKISPERRYSLRHGVRKIGVWMYARELGECGKRWWSVKEVVERWPMKKYEGNVRHVVGEERAEWVMGLPGRLEEWVEMRGEELEKWK